MISWHTEQYSSGTNSRKSLHVTNVVLSNSLSGKELWSRCIPGFFVRGIFESQLARLVLLHPQWISLQPHPRSWWGYQVWCALCCQYWETCATLWSVPWEWCELDQASTPCVLLETWCTHRTVGGCDVLGLFFTLYWRTETCTACRLASRTNQTQRR